MNRDSPRVRSSFDRAEDAYGQRNFVDAFCYMVDALPEGRRSRRMRENIALPDSVGMYLQTKIHNLWRGHSLRKEDLDEFKKFLDAYTRYVIHTGQGIDQEIISALEIVVDKSEEAA